MKSPTAQLLELIATLPASEDLKAEMRRLVEEIERKHEQAFLEAYERLLKKT